MSNAMGLSLGMMARQKIQDRMQDVQMQQGPANKVASSPLSLPALIDRAAQLSAAANELTARIDALALRVSPEPTASSSNGMEQFASPPGGLLDQLSATQRMLEAALSMAGGRLAHLESVL